MKIISCIRALIVLIVLATTHEFFHTIHRALWQVRHVVVSYDKRLSDEAQREIEIAIRLMENNGTYNPRSLMMWLPTQFRYIENISMRYMPYHTAICTIDAHEPHALVNGNHALLEDGSLVSASCYAVSSLAVCPALTMITEHVPLALPTRITIPLLSLLAHEMMAQYRPVLVNEHELHLYDKQNPAFYIVCDAVRMPEKEALEYCQSLKKKMLERSARNTSILWRADIRFHDQIIVSMEKGGGYGSYIS